jgi:glucokinase
MRKNKATPLGNKMGTKKYVGVDIGGSKVAFVVLTANGLHPIEVHRLPLPRKRTAKTEAMEIIGQVGYLVSKYRDDVAAVGVASAPVMDFANGTIVRWGSRPAWKGIPLQNLFVESLGRPVLFDNDVNLTCLAEWEALPRSQRPKVLVTVAIGTGLGGGVVIDGTIFGGTHGQAANLGHILYIPEGADCPCGSNGCLQTVASGLGIVRLARSFAAQLPGGFTIASQLGRPDSWTAHSLAMRGADLEWVQRAFVRAAEAVAWGMYQMRELFDPDRIVVTGGVMNSRELFVKPLMRCAAGLGLSSLVTGPTLQQDLSAAIGAAIAGRRLRAPGHFDEQTN